MWDYVDAYWVDDIYIDITFPVDDDVPTNPAE
jgi:hypothetical protein